MADGDDIGLDHKGFIAGDAMTSADLRQILDCGYRALYLQIAARDSEANQNADGDAKFGKVERDMVAGDDARFFKPVDSLGDCRCREANLPADLRKGLACIVLQGFKNLPGNLVELDWVANGPVRHMPPIIRQYIHLA